MSYECGLCPKYLESERQLMKHRKLRHGDQFNLHGLMEEKALSQSLLARVNQYQEKAKKKEMGMGKRIALSSGIEGPRLEANVIAAQSSCLGDRLRCRLSTLEGLVASLFLDNNKSRDNLSNDVIKKLNDPKDGHRPVEAAAEAEAAATKWANGQQATGRARKFGFEPGGISVGGAGRDKAGCCRYCSMPLEDCPNEWAALGSQSAPVNANLSSTGFGQMLESIVRRTIVNVLNPNGGIGSIAYDGCSDSSSSKRATGSATYSSLANGSPQGRSASTSSVGPITRGANLACSGEASSSSVSAAAAAAAESAAVAMAAASGDGKRHAIVTDVFGACRRDDSDASRDGQELMEWRPAEEGGSPIAGARLPADVGGGGGGGGEGRRRNQHKIVQAAPPTTSPMAEPMASGCSLQLDGQARGAREAASGEAKLEVEVRNGAVGLDLGPIGLIGDKTEAGTAAAAVANYDVAGQTTTKLAVRPSNGVALAAGESKEFSSWAGVNLVAYQSNDRKLNSRHESGLDPVESCGWPSAATGLSCHLPHTSHLEALPPTGGSQRASGAGGGGGAMAEVSSSEGGEMSGLVARVPDWPAHQSPAESKGPAGGPAQTPVGQLLQFSDKSLRSEAPEEELAAATVCRTASPEPEVHARARESCSDVGEPHYCSSSSRAVRVETIGGQAELLGGEPGGSGLMEEFGAEAEAGFGLATDATATAVLVAASVAVAGTGSEVGGARGMAESEPITSAGLGLGEIAALADCAGPAATAAEADQQQQQRRRQQQQAIGVEFSAVCGKPLEGPVAGQGDKGMSQAGGAGGSFARATEPIEGEDNVNLFAGSRGPSAASSSSSGAGSLRGYVAASSSSTNTASSTLPFSLQTFQEMGAARGGGGGEREGEIGEPAIAAGIEAATGSSSSSTLTPNNNSSGSSSSTSGDNNNNNNKDGAIYCCPNSSLDEISNVETNISYAQQSDKQHQQQQQPHRQDPESLKPTGGPIVCDAEATSSAPNAADDAAAAASAARLPANGARAHGGEPDITHGARDGPQPPPAGPPSFNGGGSAVGQKEAEEAGKCGREARELEGARASGGSSDDDGVGGLPRGLDSNSNSNGKPDEEFEAPLNSHAAPGSSLIDLACSANSTALTATNVAQCGWPKSGNESGGGEGEAHVPLGQQRLQGAQKLEGGVSVFATATAAAAQGDLSRFEGRLGRQAAANEQRAAAAASSQPPTLEPETRPASLRKLGPSQRDGDSGGGDDDDEQQQKQLQPNKQLICLQDSALASSSGSSGGGGKSRQLGPKSILKFGGKRRSLVAVGRAGAADEDRSWSGIDERGGKGEGEPGGKGTAEAGQWGRTGTSGPPGYGLQHADGSRTARSSAGAEEPKATRRRSLVRFSETHLVRELSPAPGSESSESCEDSEPQTNSSPSKLSAQLELRRPPLQASLRHEW